MILEEVDTLKIYYQEDYKIGVKVMDCFTHEDYINIDQEDIYNNTTVIEAISKEVEYYLFLAKLYYDISYDQEKQK